MNNSPQPQTQSNWPRVGLKALLSTGGLAALTGVLTWIVTTSYERGQQSSQLSHLTVQLAKLENVDAQRVAMKDRAETAERHLRDAMEQVAQLRDDLNSVRGQLGAAQASISKGEKCSYLETLAKISAAKYANVESWASSHPNGYADSYYREAAANFELDRTNLTACLTGSTK
ncbi:hypothetical protein M5J07_20925 [Achromobacter mucicolens]|uniref:hypothetical protein n=1 Tax=Achromobacter mucicolens TaxID=1389922 RepID=UPI0020A5B9F5|nr:hypothetical protein [Achromobacter mucicolens]MCP2517416.1 hypothetical protein [Achromobacter mucicolens]